MGAWGGGLYDSDFTRDLKALIAGVLRAPLSDEDILSEIWDSQGRRAGGLDELDYWLVLADQLERRGLPRSEVFERAIAIVEKGEDAARLQALGASPKTIAKRRTATAELLQRLRAPRPAKQRRPLREPQPLLFEAGDVLTWPTDRGDSINPYVPEDKLWKLGGFTQDGWGFGIVTDAGHQFEVLAYYAVQVLRWRRPERPSIELAAHCARSDHAYGTMTELHVKRARVERLGRAPAEALGAPPHPDVARRSARRVTLEDIGIWDVFGLDAFNSSIWPRLKFPHPAPSGAPIDPDEPDQRPGFGWSHET
jgi:hypothetical protein